VGKTEGKREFGKPRRRFFRIILKWFRKKWGGISWTLPMWLRLRKSDRLYLISNKSSVSLNSMALHPHFTHAPDSSAILNDFTCFNSFTGHTYDSRSSTVFYSCVSAILIYELTIDG